MIPHASILKRRLLSADLTLYFANDNDASRCEASTSDGGKRPPEDHISHGNQKATDVRRSDGGKGSAGISTSGFDVITTDISNSDAEKIATDVSTKVGEDSLVDVSNSDVGKKATDVSTSQGGKRQAEINGRCSEAGKRVESERIGIGPDFSWEDKTNTGKK